MSKFVLTAQLQLQAPNNVGQVVQQIQNQLNGINVNIQVQGSQQAQKQIQQVTNSTNQATTAAERMGKAFALSIRRFAAFSIATRGVGLFTSSLSNAIQTAIDFERELIKVSQVTGKSIGQLRGLTKEITSLSTGLGVSSSDLLNVTTVLAQAGLTAEDTARALRILAKSALAPNFDSITETTEGAIAILAQFQEGVGALEAQLGSINAVAGAFAVEAGDLIDVVRRTGGVFKSSGGSLNELLALFTSVRATTRESAESIGTGLRTIFTRIQRPKTIEFLKQFGVELVDLDGKFVGPYESIRRLSEALAGLGEGDLTFISIAEELGGFRQIGKVLPLLQQFSTAQSALNVAMKSGDSLTQDAASAQAALAIRIMRVREEFLALIRSVTETSTFQIMANTALSLASALIKIGDSIKPLLPMLAALAAFKIAKGLGGFFGGMMSGAASGRAYNKGGKVHHFARGGLVPGTGNRDTVPAMLSPGEFVIRKSSVNKMGAGTLAAMNENRYAAGGIINENKIGAAILENVGFDSSNTIKVTRQDIESKLPKTLRLNDNYPIKTQKSFTLEREGLSGNTYNSFSKILKENLVKVAENSAQSLAADLGLSGARTSIPRGDVTNFLRGINDGSVGNLFEDTLKVLSGSPFSTESQRAFDFDTGISSVLKDDYKNITSKYVDAKSSLAQSGPSKFQVKAANALAFEARQDNYVRQELEDEKRKRESSELKGAFGKSAKKRHFGGLIQRFASGGGVDPKDTLERFYKDSSSFNLGLANSKGLGKGQRKQLASDVRDMRKLRSQAPATLYSSISRVAFDRMASQVGLNKNPKIPEGTKLFDRAKYYSEEVQKIIGKVFSLPGFVSTSKDASKAKSFLDNAPRADDQWAAMMTILTKSSAKGVDVASQLSGRTINATKQDINPRTGKMETFSMNQPGSENEFTLSPKSRFRINSAKFVDMIGRKNLWMDVQQFKEGGEAEVPKRTIRGLFSDQDVAAAAQRKGMSFAQLKAELEARHDTGFKDYKIQDWEIKKKYGLVPSPFNVGAYSAAAAARDKEKTSAFHNRKRFAAGGGVGTDTVPALLTPGEFVINRKSAQGIGYGALGRMNKVGKYAKGGVVQRFAAGGGVGTGVKPSSAIATPGLDPKVPSLISRAAQVLTDTFQSTSQAWRQSAKASTLIEKFSYELSDSLIANSNASNYTAQQQAKLTDAYARAVQSMLKMGYTDDQILAKSAELAAALDADTKAKIASAAATTAASSSATSAAALAGGGSGSRVQASFGVSDTSMSKLKLIDKIVPGFIQSLVENQNIVGRSSTSQSKLIESVLQNVDNLRSSGMSVKDISKALQKFKVTVDNKGQEIQSSKFNLATNAMSNIKNTEMNLGASTASLALASGVDQSALASNRKKSFTDAGFTKNGQSTLALLEAKRTSGLKIDPSRKLTESEQSTNVQVAQSRRQSRGDSRSTADILKAARASSTPSGGSGSPGKSPSGGGMGQMLGDNKMMAASMATSMIQGFLPAVDDSSSAMLKMTHSMLGLITTVASVGFALEAFGMKLAAGDIMKFFTGKGGSLVNKAASYARAGTSAAGRGLTSVGGKLASQGGMVGKAGGMIGNLGTKALGSVGGVENAVTALGKLAGPAIAAAGAVYAFSSIVDSATDYQGKLNKAIEKGNVEQAGKMAVEKAGAEAVNNVAMGMAAIGSAIPVVGPAMAAVAGAALKVASELPVIGPAVKSAAIWISTLFGGKNEASIRAMAEASAQAAKTTKALEQGQKDASKAMDDFKNGSISAVEALGRIQGAQQEVDKLGQKTSEAIDKNNSNKGGGFRQFGAYATLGYVDSNEERNKKIDTENVAQNKTFIDAQRQSFSQSSELRNAAIRSTIARGGSQEDAAAKLGAYDPNKLREQSVEAGKKAMRASRSGDDATAEAYTERQKMLIEQAREVESAMANIAKEVENAKKSFEAMNLGLRSATATASALSAGMDRFSAGLEVGGSTFVSDVEFLQQSLSSAAQSMDPAEIKNAMANVSQNLSQFGVSPQQIAKFEGNINAFTQAQANYNSAFANIKKSMKDADFKNLNADQLKDKFAEELTKGMDKDAKKNLGDVIKGLDLQPDDVDKIVAGDLSVFGDKLSESQKKMLEDVQKIAAERAKAEQVLIDFTKKRIDAERNLVQAQQEALDLTMEGREIQGKYGGRAVTGRERKDNLLAKSNAESSRLGLSAMKTGDTGDLRRRNTEIKTLFSDLEGRRSQQGGLAGKSGVEADEAQKDLQKAYKTQIDTIRGLIKLEEDQLKIIEEKNKLEKESMESLIKGDIEEFFKKQSAVGATAAIASGDTRLQNLYGADALGTAAMDIKRQQDAGVQSVYGQQLAGPGGLTEAASSAALSSRGITDMRAAQVMAGTTAEEEASKTRLRELGGMLGETGDLGTEMAEMQVNTATINVNSAELKFKETMDRGNKAAEEANKAENVILGRDSVKERMAVTRARGGMIYANRGIFVPRGTDTVPAMLTPGEFVVNRGAVQRGNNLHILQSMNNGLGSVSNNGGTALMAAGGIVRYRSEGSTGAEQPSQGMSSFTNALENFNRELTKNVQSLRDTKISIKLDSTSISVNLNDGGLLKALTSQVKTEIFNLVKNNLVAGDGGKLRESSSVLT